MAAKVDGMVLGRKMVASRSRSLIKALGLASDVAFAVVFGA